MPDPRVRALFAGLRESLDEPPDRTPSASGTATHVSASSEPATEVEPASTLTDDAVRQGRDALLADAVPNAERVAKRRLQDEQNDLLDATRRARSRIDPVGLVAPIAPTTAWCELLGSLIEGAYTAGRQLVGRTRRGGGVAPRVVVDLVDPLVTPLRDRLVATIETVVEEGPYESSFELQRALATAISARYREWKAQDLEVRLGDMLSAAYARGAYDAAQRAARLRWIPAEVGQCPDADDNALEPTAKGDSFPTGQRCPPAHPGCRCLVIPAGI